MNRILEIDIENEFALVQPGVVNLDITLAVAALRIFLCSRSSSQRACTIGGNVAENAGGPHTLAYGVTTNHVVSLEAVLPDGTRSRSWAAGNWKSGLRSCRLLTGSEGTMALVTKIGVRLMRAPESVKTMLAIYNSVAEAGNTVGDHGARHHTGRARDAGRADAADGGGGDACRISPRRGGGAADRVGRV